MKKTKLLGLAFIATMASFTACTNDSEEVLAQESEIKLTSEITPSRVADSELQSTQIVAGREVGVTITGAKNDEAETKNMLWTVNDNGSLNNEGTPVYYGDGSATVTAYHPYNSTWTSTSHFFSVSTNQTEETDYLNSDLLWATASSAKKESAISLEFAHKLAKINVTLVPEKNGDDLNGATISIVNTKISTTFNPATGDISEATGNAEEIIAGVTADDVYTATAIVIPQTVSGKFVKITHEGKTYYYTLVSGKTLESGHSYSYTLTVKGKQLISTGSSIDEWDDTEDVNEGDAEEEIMDANSVTLISAGTLSTIISEEEKYKITSLTISGPLNGDDIAFLREMAGYKSEGKLEDLNLADANIVEGGDNYFLDYSTTENVIGNSAFYSCPSLKNIIIPNSVTLIGAHAFSNSNLISITIPSNVNQIEAGAFQNCLDLTDIYITDLTSWCNISFNDDTSNPLYYGDHFFVQGVEINHLIIPTGVTKIRSHAFYGAKFSAITIPNGVEYIYEDAFYKCSNITSITIPSSVLSISNYAFAYCI